MRRTRITALLDTVALPEVAWELLANQAGTALAVAASPSCPPSVRDQLTSSSRDAIRHQALSHSSAPEQLALAATSKAAYVCEAAARNDRTPPDVLAELVSHRSPRVVLAALTNASLPPAAAMAAAGRNPAEVLGANRHVAIGRADQIAERHMALACAWIDQRTVRQALARRTDTPDAIFEHLLADRSIVTAEVIALNPTVPTEALRKRQRRLRQQSELFESGEVGEITALRCQQARKGDVTVLKANSPTLNHILAGRLRSFKDLTALFRHYPRAWPDTLAKAWKHKGDPRKASACMHLMRDRIALRQLCDWTEDVATADRDARQAVSALGTDRTRWELFIALESSWEGTLSNLAAATTTLA